ncbi:UNVERIFIED_CONTAM: hypothetical protein GTU68_002333 [Idotea baltica]|nr:hypothetical protein [Idotea baltica]
MKNLMKPYLLNIRGYSSARDEFKGQADIFLDANENPFNNGYNRYPDSQQKRLRTEVAKLKGLPIDQIFLSNGSDIIVDKLIRIFCTADQDSILINTPTFPMYAVMANVNNINIINVPKTSDHQLDIETLINVIKTQNPKIVFLCSPNNPVGNSLHRDDLLAVLKINEGITLIDEAYIDFSPSDSFISELANYPNLAVIQTFSKAWGLAGIRLGACYGPPLLIDILKRISAPYEVNALVQKVGLDYLQDSSIKEHQVSIILSEKDRLREFMAHHDSVKVILPSDTNFLVVQFHDGPTMYKRLLDAGIVTRNLHKALPDHLRITVGTKEENKLLIHFFEAL